jgi:hypothetical protein
MPEETVTTAVLPALGYVVIVAVPLAAVAVAVPFVFVVVATLIGIYLVAAFAAPTLYVLVFYK